MLIQFSVENFLSIKDNVVLSLLASKDNDCLLYTSTIRKGDYLTSAGIVHGIEVVYEDGVLEVTLPGCLLYTSRCV